MSKSWWYLCCCSRRSTKNTQNPLQSTPAPAPKKAPTPAPKKAPAPALTPISAPAPKKAPAPAPAPTPTSKQQPKLQSNEKYNCFLTHNWGNRLADGSYDNHERVRRIYQGLQSKGVSCWFDSERMTGTIQEQMSKGIDDSDCVVGIKLYF